LALTIGLREQAVVFRELATLIGAGITLVQALSDLQQRPSSKACLHFLRSAQRRIGSGDSFSSVMNGFPGTFSELTVALVSAGEESGKLDDMLRDVAEYLERELALRQMIAQETFYAKILIGACIVIPLAAQSIIAFITQGSEEGLKVAAQGLLSYLLLIGIPAALLYAVYRRISSSATGRRGIDALKLRVPLLGGVVRGLALAKFARAFAVLFDAGVQFQRTIRLAAGTMGNSYLTEMVAAAVPRVEQGGRLSEVLMQTRLSNELLVRLLQTGEQTGNVDEMMHKAAEYYEGETQSRIKKLSVTIVPVTVVIMGIVVALMVIRFYVGQYSELLNSN
jgi:type II secretory pathway component PulF